MRKASSRNGSRSRGPQYGHIHSPDDSVTASIAAAMASRQTSQKMMHNDEIPAFANFDSPAQIKYESSPSPKARSKKSPGRPSSRSKRIDINDLEDASGVYDPEDIASYKWAKFQAAEIAENQSINNESTGKNIRRPSHGGFLRSTSSTSQHRHQSQSQSITPNRRNGDNNAIAQSVNGGYAPKIPPNGPKTRTRSRSPRTTSSQHSSKHQQSRQHRNGTPIAANGQRDETPTAVNGKGRNKPIIASSRNLKSTKNVMSEEELQMKKRFANKKYTFQTSTQLVTCRSFDLNARAAFEKRKLVTVAQLYEVAKARPGGSNVYSQASIASRMKKISPSPQHLEILEAMGNISSTRQICWSPAVSPEADPFFGWEDDGHDDGEIEESKDSAQRSATSRVRRRKMLLAKKRRESAAKRVGKYRRIDPVEYIKNTMPDHEPLLTDVRRRLPMRCDVGFPRATEEEFLKKQEEIAREAQLEEISPRLIVLLNSDDLGSPPDLTIDGIMDKACMKQLDCKIPGIPFATNALLMAKRNASVVRETKGDQSRSRKVAPDLNSIFAPPIDATSSSAEIWRARPFSDRPAGLVHSLAIPLNVTFGVGNIEPLVCTLSLYCLPKRGKHTGVHSKISEDFVFPAGDWKDLLEEKAGKILALQFGMDDTSSEKRVKKALFSFDPSVLSSSDTGDGKESLHILMQVHKVTHVDADDAYIDRSKATGSSPFNLSRKGSIGHMFGNVNKSSSSSFRRDHAPAAQRAGKAFDTLGTQFLTPFCFGILPLFPKQSQDDCLQWPHGISQTMRLFSHPVNESEDNFIDRLISIAEYVDENPAIVDDIELSTKSAESESFDSHDMFDSTAIGRAVSSEDGGSSRGHKKRSSFRVRRKHKSRLPPTSNEGSVDTTKLNGIKLADGTATFYISAMGSDFSQALLQSPAFLNHGYLNASPRLLVDTSGDYAIMVNPEQNASSSRRRSNLIRLPPASIGSGYADSSEVREVLYLPPTVDGIFQPAAHGTHRNLLYLYPRLITNGKHEPTRKSQCYSVRTRLVRQDLEVDESTGATNTIYNPDNAIYNPTPLGDPIVQAVYTKIPLCATLKKQANISAEGICLRDEIKIRLPDVLDGSHFIQFSLFMVEVNSDFGDDSGGLRQSLVAETLIPLSSSSTKESTFDTKVSTVIPNGLHRIKLSHFQLQVQSLLVSDIHISDPAVATVMRDFSAVQDDKNERSQIVPYSDILSRASQESVVSHFQPLLFMHLRHFVNQGNLGFNCNSGEAFPSKLTVVLLENMRSLIALVGRVKKNTASGMYTDLHIKKLLKHAFDSFDDKHFHQRKQSSRALKSSSRSISTEISDGSTDSNNEDEFGKAVEDLDEDGAANFPVKIVPTSNLHRLSSRINSREREHRLQQVYSSLHSETPFNRKAYGASKTDRMKAEAELYESGQIFSELADDDETVVTAATWHSQARMNSVSFPAPVNRHSSSNTVDGNTRNTDLKTLFGSPSINDDTEAEAVSLETPFEKARDIARRMNAAAQIFVAPCVAPQLHSGSRTLGSSRRIRQLHASDPRIQYLRSHTSQDSVSSLLLIYTMRSYLTILTDFNLIAFQQQTKCLIYEGSDDDNEDVLKDKQSGKSKPKFAPLPNGSPAAPLRGVATNSPVEIHFSLSSAPGLETDGTPPYVYEIILALWLHCLNKDLGGTRLNNDKKTMQINPRSFLQSMDFLLPLCLKSFVLRCSNKPRRIELVPSIVLDMQHMQLLGPLVEHLANSLVYEVVHSEDPLVDKVLADTLSSSDCVLEFFVGLLSTVHPAQVSWLISNYLRTLKECEDYSLDKNSSDDAQTTQYLKRIRTCRQLRLRAVERLASLPRFAALNYPFKYHAHNEYRANTASSWTNQAKDGGLEHNPSGVRPVMSPVIDEKLPVRHWLAELLLNECFAICSQSCEAIVSGTIHQLKSANTKKNQSAMRLRIALTAKDVAHHQSIAYHSITIAYESLLRKQATDDRFQSEEGLSRIAAMCKYSVCYIFVKLCSAD